MENKENRIIVNIFLTALFSISLSSCAPRVVVKEEVVVKPPEKVEEEVPKVEEKEEMVGKILWVKGWNELIYKEPGYEGEVLKLVDKGHRLEAIEKKGKWVKVKAEDGEIGWANMGGLTEKEVKPLEIKEKRLMPAEKEKVGEYLKKAIQWYESRVEKKREVEEKFARGEIDDVRMVRAIRKIYSECPTEALNNYYLAYRIDSNNLEAIKGIVNMLEEVGRSTPDHVEIGSDDAWIQRKELKQYKSAKEYKIELCNRALALNPSDPGVYYAYLENFYKASDRPHKRNIAIEIVKNRLEIMERKGIPNPVAYYQNLETLANWEKNIEKKLYYLKRIIDEIDEKCPKCPKGIRKWAIYRYNKFTKKLEGEKK